MVKCRRNPNLEEMNIELVQEEKTWILSTVRNIEGVRQTKYYYDSVKKRKFSLVVICRLTKN